MRKFNKQAGFTLIQSLVSLAILGVLLSFAIPQYHKNVKKAGMTACETEVYSYRQQLEIDISSGSVNNTSIIPDNYNGTCSNIEVTVTQAEVNIVATYENPENSAKPTYEIMRTSNGRWNEVDTTIMHDTKL